MQWSSMGNVVLLNNMTNGMLIINSSATKPDCVLDMNMHGGYEGNRSVLPSKVQLTTGNSPRIQSFRAELRQCSV